MRIKNLWVGSLRKQDTYLSFSIVSCPLDIQLHFTGSRRRYRRLVHLSIAKTYDQGRGAPSGGFLEISNGALEKDCIYSE